MGPISSNYNDDPPPDAPRGLGTKDPFRRSLLRATDSTRFVRFEMTSKHAFGASSTNSSRRRSRETCYLTKSHRLMAQLTSRYPSQPHSRCVLTLGPETRRNDW